MHSHKFQFGSLCRGRNSSVPLTHPCSPCHRPQRHLLLGFSFPYASLGESSHARPQDGHPDVLSHKKLYFFFFSSVLGWNSDFQAANKSRIEKQAEILTHPSAAYRAVGSPTSDEKFQSTTVSHIARWHQCITPQSSSPSKWKHIHII